MRKGLITLSIIGLIIVALFFYTRVDPRITVLQRTINRHLKEHRRQPNKWWFATLPDSVTPEFKDFIQSRREQIERTRDSSKNLSKLTTDIVNLFSDFDIALYRQGQVISIGRLGKPGDRPVVMFIVADQLDREIFPTRALWDPNRHMMQLWGIAWPDKVFSGILIHEMVHAVYDMKYDTTSSKESNGVDHSDAWIGEELVANDLQHSIEDNATSGGYFKAVDRILERSSKSADVIDVVTALTDDDLLRLDAGLSVLDVGIDVALRIDMDHLYIMGMRYLERQGASQQQRIQYYRWFTGFGSNANNS